MEEKINRAKALWQSAQTEPDEVNIWGFYSYGDAPPAIGGGVGSFAWFETRNELLQFIRDVLPYSPPGSSGADWNNVETDVHQIIAQAVEGKIDDRRAVEALNDALKTFSQIEWLGTFDDLIRSSHPFAERIRLEFWELEEEDNKADRQTISDDEIAAFRQFLAEYGI
jgi:hypothetical protein